MPPRDKPRRTPSARWQRSSDRTPAASAVSTALKVTGWTLLATLLAATLMLVLAGAAGGPLLGTVRSLGHLWATAHGSGLEVNGIDLTLLPLGSLALVAATVGIVTAKVLDGPVTEPAAFVATVAGSYGAAVAAIAAASNTTAVATSPGRAAIVTFVVAAAGAAAGYSWAEGVPSAWWPAERADLRAVITGAAEAASIVVVAAALGVIVMLSLSVGRAGDLWALLDPGLGGGLALAVVCVLLVPTLTAWAVAVLLGPGFSVGTDTSVDLTASYLGEVPGIPVLAALPAPGEFDGWVVVFALVPVLAAATAGWRQVRRGRVEVAASLTRGLGLVAASGALGGFVLAIFAWASAGSVGPGRMSEVGPTSLLALMVSVPVMAVGAAIGAVLAHYRGGRASR